jgi:tetratricopeptide (TPR) repeat protein
VQKGKTQLQTGSADMALASGEAAIKKNADRWEAYALAGGALMNMKRYEEAADKLSEAIKRAPGAKQPTLRELRKQSLLAESSVAPAEKKELAASTTSQAEIVLWKSIENSSNSADFQSYLDEYPKGAFVVLAQRHLAAENQQAEYEQEKHRKQQDEERRTLTWTDPSTGLTWTKKSPREGRGGFYDWNAAHNYCATLRLLSYAWRMPTIDELVGISDPATNESGYHIKGDITLSEAYKATTANVVWSSNPDGDRRAWYFLYDGKTTHTRNWPRSFSTKSVLCVRSSDK